MPKEVLAAVNMTITIFLGYDALWSGRTLLIFRRKFLIPSYILKTESAGSSETFEGILPYCATLHP